VKNRQRARDGLGDAHASKRVERDAEAPLEVRVVLEDMLERREDHLGPTSGQRDLGLEVRAHVRHDDAPELRPVGHDGKWPRRRREERCLVVRNAALSPGGALDELPRRSLGRTLVSVIALDNDRVVVSDDAVEARVDLQDVTLTAVADRPETSQLGELDDHRLIVAPTTGGRRSAETG
jgi:hypothetical protein